MAAGDVLENGSIDLGGRKFISSGRVFVTADQATAAEAKGWTITVLDGERSMVVKGDGDPPAIRA